LTDWAELWFVAATENACLTPLYGGAHLLSVSSFSFFWYYSKTVKKSEEFGNLSWRQEILL
jgi:hypothetical protein